MKKKNKKRTSCIDMASSGRITSLCKHPNQPMIYLIEITVIQIIISYTVILQCFSYLDCDGYAKGEFVMCVNGKCKANTPCNKDDDCAFYGMLPRSDPL